VPQTQPQTSETEARKGRRDALIQQAKALFLKHGYKKTTLDDVAKALGLGKTALYYYFRSKDELFTAIVQLESQNLLEAVRNASSAQATPGERLRSALLAHFQVISPYFASSGTAAEMSDLLSIAGPLRKRFEDEEVLLLEGILAEGVRVHAFRSIRPRETAAMIAAALRGIESRFAEDRRVPAGDPRVELLLSLLSEGLTPR
jgi:AcrR family transcriptional regulator